MESLNGFIRRHSGTSRDKFLSDFPHPFLASRQKPESADSLFPGSWVIPVRKRAKELIGDSVTLGRAADSDIRIDAEAVSKHHCDFLISAGDIRVADANSTNGTFVNGARLAPKAPHAIKSGDRISFGETLVFYYLGPGELYDLLFGKKPGAQRG